MTIESTIQRLTKDGEIVVQFLVDTVQGNIYNATVGHRLKSAEWLAALGGTIPEDALPKSASIRPKPKSKPQKDKPGKRDKPAKKPLVTEKQILHFDIARLIKDETRDGETIIEFLIRVVAKIERPGENFTPAARIRAARELLIRGYGSCIPGINRIQSGKTEELDSYISKSIREYTGYGADPVRFLIDVMENKTPELDSKGAVDYKNKIIPQRKENVAFEGFKALQRVWAACELFRRGYDIRTDHITYADIQAYWNSQTPAVESAADDADDDEPDYSKLGITREAVEAEVAKMIASDAAKAAAASATDKPIDKTPDENGNSPTPNSAERRRQKRAARKAQKRAAADAKAAAASAATEKPAAANTTDGNASAHSAPEKPVAAAANPTDAKAAAASAATKKPAAANTTANNGNRSAATEKPVAAAEDNQVSAQKPDENGNSPTPNSAATEKPAAKADSAATPNRAERRRQKRAARKAQKRANNASNKPASAVAPENQAPSANNTADDSGVGANNHAVDIPDDSPNPPTYFNSPEFEAELWRRYHEGKARNAHTMATDPFYEGVILPDPLTPKVWKQWKKNMDYYELAPKKFFEIHGEYPDPNNIPPPPDIPPLPPDPFGADRRPRPP